MKYYCSTDNSDNTPGGKAGLQNLPIAGKRGLEPIGFFSSILVMAPKSSSRNGKANDAGSGDEVEELKSMLDAALRVKNALAQRCKELEAANKNRDGGGPTLWMPSPQVGRRDSASVAGD